MKPREDSASTTGERRSDHRYPIENHVRMLIDRVELDGHAGNISRGGVLFMTDDRLPVSVEIEENGVVQRIEGHLVRMERCEEGGGWAIEFEK